MRSLHGLRARPVRPGGVEGPSPDTEAIRVVALLLSVVEHLLRNPGFAGSFGRLLRQTGRRPSQSAVMRMSSSLSCLLGAGLLGTSPLHMTQRSPGPIGHRFSRLA